MELNDEYIKLLILRYKESNEGLTEIVDYLSLFIYYFPKLVSYDCTEDLFGSYYEYFLERLPKIVVSYTPMPNVLFKTWFYVVQRRHYLNFIKTYNRVKTDHNCDIVDSSNLDLLTIYSGEDKNSSNSSDIDFSYYLSSDELLFMKLFTPDNLTRDDFLNLMNMLDCDISTLMVRIRILFDASISDDGKRAVKLVPIQGVAKFLDWNRSKVSKKLDKIRKKMQKIYIWED